MMVVAILLKGAWRGLRGHAIPLPHYILENLGGSAPSPNKELLLYSLRNIQATISCNAKAMLPYSTAIQLTNINVDNHACTT